MNSPIENIQVFWIDLFCGAGGTTTGIEQANANASVIACVNHDQNAILSHRINHPGCLHLTEDVRDLKVVHRLHEITTSYRKRYPGCFINLWASLECTNYSKAKGGLPRDADSRTLAHHLLPYVQRLVVDYLFIENVVEFMAWGPLDINGRPISRQNGRDFLGWKQSICALGYRYDHRILNAADYGGYTIRKRYFAQFARDELPIRWPKATHSKEVNSESAERGANLFGQSYQRWRPVREVLDLADEGNSIFHRKKPLAENTLKRIYAGLLKFAKPRDGPATSSGEQSLTSEFLTTYYGNGASHSPNDPSPTLRTKDTVAKVTFCRFIDQQYGCSKPSNPDDPAGALTSNPKLNLVSVSTASAPPTNSNAKECQPWILNPQFSNRGSGINRPSPTLIARMDKKPLYLVRAEQKASPELDTSDNDSNHPERQQTPFDLGASPTTKLIRGFMREHGIADIKMRMLKKVELLKIQGFPEDYVLQGTMTEQKKFIGNSVHTLIAEKLAETNYQAVSCTEEKDVA